jgi:nucleoside-diphosphate-sugar epimerase
VIGIVGHRSWIAHELFGKLARAGHHVVAVDKADLGSEDLGHIDCLYLVLGRAKPTEQEQQDEIDQASRLILGAAGGFALPKRIVYLSSMVQTRAKTCVEALLLRHKHLCRIEICRPAAVFGPGQDPNSSMLVPSLARDETLELRTPDKLTKFIHVDALTDWLVQFADLQFRNHNGNGEPGSIFRVPGTFTMTPRQMKALVNTVREYVGDDIRSSVQSELDYFGVCRE